ncbi:MAG TPA: hypothetical protein VMN36_17550 [Verrucomicrobiales bacterium]|nr:hypothetical protein [Verrucomicrobiales bacterium]
MSDTLYYFGQAAGVAIGLALGYFGQEFAGVGFIGQQLEALQEVLLGPTGQGPFYPGPGRARPSTFVLGV